MNGISFSDKNQIQPFCSLFYQEKEMEDEGVSAHPQSSPRLYVVASSRKALMEQSRIRHIKL